MNETSEMVVPEFPKTQELLSRMWVWMRPILEDPGFRIYNRGKIRAALDFQNEGSPSVGDYSFPGILNAQHTAVMAFHHLHSDCGRLQDYHFYFRRFPFRRGEVERRSHVQNVFDLFFAGFYVTQQRLETYLNALALVADHKPDVGRFIKSYKKDFAAELRPRHQATHDRPYDDIVFDRLWIADVMSQRDGESKEWQREQRAMYRRETRRWAELARVRARAASSYVEAAADFTLQHAEFLNSPAYVAPVSASTELP